MTEQIRHLFVGHGAGKAIYGIIIALAIVITLEAHPPRGLEAEATILLGAFAVAIAELYSEVLELHITQRRRISRAELHRLGRHIGIILVGALLPLPIFILASFGIMEIEQAFSIVKWILVIILFIYGFVAARISGAGAGWSMLLGTMTGSIGLVVVLVKAALSH